MANNVHKWLYCRMIRARSMNALSRVVLLASGAAIYAILPAFWWAECDGALPVTHRIGLYGIKNAVFEGPTSKEQRLIGSVVACNWWHHPVFSGHCQRFCMYAEKFDNK